MRESHDGGNATLGPRFEDAVDPIDRARKRGSSASLERVNGIGAGLPYVRRLRDGTAAHAVLLVVQVGKIVAKLEGGGIQFVMNLFVIDCRRA